MDSFSNLPWFTKDDMEEEGALELHNADLGDISNDIHPALNQTLFKNLSNADYALLSPSLRLVSRFFDEPSLLPYWGALILGERRRLPRKLEAKYGQPMYSFHCVQGGMTVEDVRTTMEALTNLRGCVTYEFVTMKDETIWGRTDIDLLKSGGGLPGYKGESVSVFLNIAYLMALRETDISISQRLRIQYHIALIFLHELGHAVRIATTEIEKDAEGYLILPALEPFFEDDRQAECGYACTQALINGSIDAYYYYPSCERGLLITKWPTVFSHESEVAKLATIPQRRRPKRFITSYVVGMEYIQSLFTDEFWEVDVRRFGAAEVRIEGMRKRLGYRDLRGEDYVDQWEVLSNDSSNESWRTPRNGVRGQIRRPDWQSF